MRPTGSDILVVDDEADIRDLVSGLLEDEGHAVRVAANSDEALAAIRARKPSLAILDIWMQGGGLDGLELLEVVKELDPDLPVVMISGHGNIRQLRNNIERLLILATGDPAETITADMLAQEVATSNGGGANLGGERTIALPLREAREVFEREYLAAQIMRFGGNISRTAAFIGMERSALHRKLKSLGVSPARGGEEDEPA